MSATNYFESRDVKVVQGYLLPVTHRLAVIGHHCFDSSKGLAVSKTTGDQIYMPTVSIKKPPLTCADPIKTSQRQQVRKHASQRTQETCFIWWTVESGGLIQSTQSPTNAMDMLQVDVDPKSSWRSTLKGQHPCYGLSRLSRADSWCRWLASEFNQQ